MSKKALLEKFLKGTETGDAMAAAVVNEEKYIRHNPQTHEGSEGIAALFARLSKMSPRVNIIRVFEDGDYAFAHNEYDLSSVRSAFEVFRFEENQAVEHWDNIQPLQGPNLSGHTMLDGATEVSDYEKTNENRAFIRSFIEDVLVARKFELLGEYLTDEFIQHSPDIADGIPAFREALEETTTGELRIQYVKLHKVLAEGNFVLAMNEGKHDGIDTSFYDLFRIADGRIVEHWDTVETIPPRSEWKNENGKF